MLHIQVTPSQLGSAEFAPRVSEYLDTHQTAPDMAAMRYQLGRLPDGLQVLSGTQVILPAMVYLPNKAQSPPSIGIGDPEAMNGDFLHRTLKDKLRDAQKSRVFRGSNLTPGLVARDGFGTHLFLDEDDEHVGKYKTEENTELLRQLYGFDTIRAGQEFGSTGLLCMVGLVRVISGAREKAVLKDEPEDTLVDRYLGGLIDALERNGKGSQVYAQLVQENSTYRSARQEHPSTQRRR